MRSYLSTIIVLVQTCSGQQTFGPHEYGFSSPELLGFRSPESILRFPELGPRTFDAEFIPPNHELRTYDIGFRPSHHGLHSSYLGPLPRHTGYNTPYQPHLGSGYNVQREFGGGRMADSVFLGRTLPYGQRYDIGGPLYDLRPQQTNTGNTLDGGLQEARPTRVRQDSRRTTRRRRPRTQGTRRQRPGSQTRGRERPGSRRRTVIRLGEVAARGGENGFPFMGGFCPGEPCGDGGRSAGLENGIGIGSLEEFKNRRRTGRNKDLRLYEMFITRRPSVQRN
ncbi:uncharacterized protein LOC128555675 [Mercenaria mercenaria]|uniref:uncharacterized protein LOC128555675 n=1 Tax=Mercenaria mercenaria TaxID=6596 RepID=UPI00234E95B8|nr:uncharacterized protein LOC128555675 [Mercenaria mercenaria]